MLNKMISVNKRFYLDRYFSQTHLEIKPNVAPFEHYNVLRLMGLSRICYNVFYYIEILHTFHCIISKDLTNRPNKSNIL